MTEPRFGLTLSSEEHAPATLVDQAVAAEAAGFDFVGISDHFHPWIGEQGHSPFVWSVLGAISRATRSLEVGVGVSCPILRIHPVIYAQATATTACLLEGRFIWGVGTGEALNEHITGRRWPPADLRLEMLGEAIDLIRDLWSGESVTHRGKHFTVEDARIFDLPRSLPPLIVSAFGPKAAELAARKGDGLWITGVNQEVLEAYRQQGGGGQIWTQISLCWDPDRARAVERARRLWPNTALPGQLSQELRTVSDFEQAVGLVGPETMEKELPCGPDPGPIIEAIQQAMEAGIDRVYLHQIGDPLDGFLGFWQEEIRPKL
jgi:G6PDH family F420-dependent oxidoreductase